jgi:glycosyltransferase involved in cell wall biosynthesis
MRVGVIAEQLRQRVPGGIGTYVTGLLGGLVALGDPGLEVVAVTSRAPSPDPLAAIGVPIEASTHGHRMQMALWDAGLGDPKHALEILHLSSLAGPLRHSDTLARTVMVHDLAWRTHPELTTRRGARWHEVALRRALRSAAALIVPSAEVAWALTADGAEPERVVVIGEGSDHLPDPDRAGADTVLAANGISGPFILTVSTLEPRKNLSRLIAAHAAMSPELREVPLVVVGPDGWGTPVAPSDRAVLLGAQPGAVLAALYERCDAFAYVPITEGFGLPPLEAMAHGAVVVSSTTVPSVREAPGVVAVEPTDVDAIAQALERALGDEATRQAAAGQARAFAGAHRWRDTARAHVELWEALS